MSDDTLNQWLFDSAKATAKAEVSCVVPLCKKFKIGKTGQKLEYRKNLPDYKDTYDNIEEVY